MIDATRDGNERIAAEMIPVFGARSSYKRQLQTQLAYSTVKCVRGIPEIATNGGHRSSRSYHEVPCTFQSYTCPDLKYLTLLRRVLYSSN
jgi:hypothetical protein